MKSIKVVNARENNLKNITVSFPYYQLTVVSGCSGSGKSSLPDVDSIEKLCPAVSVAQNSYNFNPNSTVGTYTDLSDELRSIFSFIVNQENGTAFKARDFSFSQSKYLCKKCGGTGRIWKLSIDKIIPDPTQTLRSGGILYFSGTQASYEMRRLAQICERHGIDMDTRICDLSSDQYDILIKYGDDEKYTVKYERGAKKNCQKTGFFHGVLPELGEEYKRIKTPMIFQQLVRYMDEFSCDSCDGMKGLESTIKHFIEEISSISSLNLDYLTLSRPIPSLSGGEFQRLRLAKQLCGSMVEVLYILDEPCKGLHFLDIDNIIDISRKLVDKGNTVIAIEHNKQYISAADNIVIIGPGSGPAGGEIVQSEPQGDVPIDKHSVRHPSDAMTFNGINANTINNQDCLIPLGAITFITGVSGSGKSTLAEDVIFSSLSRKQPVHCKRISAPRSYKVHFVDQQPIGKTSRSSVISYLKISNEIRKIFADIPPKRAKITPSHFSTNCSGGRCEKCSGSGIISLDSKVMPDAYIKCDECNGKRFKPEILEIKYKGYSIFDVLEMNVTNAIQVFDDSPKIKAMLQCMIDIGIGYLKLGQLSMNLSGGEAQRIKLAKVLGEETHKNSIIIYNNHYRP